MRPHAARNGPVVFFSSTRRHTRYWRDWSSDVCSSDLDALPADAAVRLSFHRADMATLDLGRDFALIVAPSRVFQFMLTSAAQREALAALRTHLRPNGRLVLDLFDPLLDRVVPSAEVTTRGGELIHPTTGNRVTWEITGQRPDPARQLIVDDWTFSEIDASGEVLRTTTEQLTLRWSLRSEMRFLFELVAIEALADYGDFRCGPPAYCRQQVWVLGHAEACRATIAGRRG